MPHEMFITHANWLYQVFFNRDKKQHLDAWQEKFAKQSNLISSFNLLPEHNALPLLPSLSFLLHLPFRLSKPYHSRDERDFYLLDNPLRREKIFQTPMMASTGWKGALRATFWQLGYKENSEVVIRLFGNPRGSEEAQAGRLHFYPTFFDKVSLEVINPHNRATGVGERGPILMECVPAGSVGTLVVLYVPFGPQDQSEAATRAEVTQDLELLAQGIQAMLTIYGFGAKASSGFGTAQDKLAGTGILALRADLPELAASVKESAEQAQPASGLPRYLESPMCLHEDFRRLDGSLKSEEEYEATLKSRGRKYGKKEKQIYEKARKWWERTVRQLAETSVQGPMPEPKPFSSQMPPISKCEFDSLSKLVKVAKEVAARLKKGGQE